ncbi:MAG: NAD(P)H-hydrate dehydratase [Candidatus Njordarchaeia archaeon]
MNHMFPEDVHALDRNSEWLGVPPIILMENAGRSVADVISMEFPSDNFKNVVIVAGTGNNGGDGFVAARHLATLGYNVSVVLLGRRENIRSDEAKANWNRLTKMFLTVRLLEVKDSSNLNSLKDALEKAEIVVDAILGVGIRGSPRGLYGEAIKLINKMKEEKNFKVVSIDIPSGLDVYAGKIFEPAIKPDVTITFVGNKNGLSEENGGKVFIKNIGQPPESQFIVGPGDVLRVLKKRAPWSHKGDYGRIMIVGGSKFYYGAPTLSGLAALKSGADLIFIYAPQPAANAIKVYSPDLIVRPLEGDYLTMSHVDFLLKEAKNFDVIVIGPGLGLQEETAEAVHNLVQGLIGLEKKIVVDADGLKALAKFGVPAGKIILTPHAGEFKILFGTLLSTELDERGKIVKEKAREHGCTILLKGNIDVISDGEEVKFNITGNPGMTVGGTGDVLTGITAAMFSLTDSPLLAASVSAFISGYAGDLAFEDLGYSLTAFDVMSRIPETIKKLK